MEKVIFALIKNDNNLFSGFQIRDEEEEEIIISIVTGTCSFIELEISILLSDYRSLFNLDHNKPEQFESLEEVRKAIRNCCQNLGIRNCEMRRINVPKPTK